MLHAGTASRPGGGADLGAARASGDLAAIILEGLKGPNSHTQSFSEKKFKKIRMLF